MGLVDRLRSLLGRGGEEDAGGGAEPVEAPELPVFVAASPSLIEVNEMPKSMVRMQWAIASKEPAVTNLNDYEYQVARIKSKLLAALSTLIEPEPDYPEIRMMLIRDLLSIVDEENSDLFAFLRLARSKYGFERRLMTMTAYRDAVSGW